MIKKLIIGLLILLLAAFTGLFIWGYAPELSVEELKAEYANSESEFVDLGSGLSVHLRDEGPKDAPAIILLHGSNASLHTWDGWTKRLKDKYRVIRYDQAGHGLTGPHPKDCYSIDCYVAVVDRVAANRGLKRFILAGNSMGGGISYAYARAHPEKLAGLILVDASGAPQTKAADLPIGFKIARTPGINRLTQIITPRSIIEASLTQSVSNKSVVTPANVDLYWKMLRREGNRRATGLRFAEYAKRKPYKPIAASPIPTLILWGEEDKLIAASDAPWFAAQFPNSQTKIYKGIGHLPMEETPEESAADVKAWAAGVVGGGL